MKLYLLLLLLAIKGWNRSGYEQLYGKGRILHCLTETQYVNTEAKRFVITMAALRN